MGNCTSAEPDLRPWIPRNYQQDVINFNQNKRVPQLIAHQHDPLGDLFQWAERGLETQASLRRQIQNLQNQLNDRRNDIERLSRDINTAQVEARKTADRHEAFRRQSREELQRVEATHRSNMDRLKEEHSANLEIMEAEHRSEVDNMQLRHDTEVERLEENMNHFEQRKASEMKGLQAEHRKHTKKLVGQLLVNQDDDKGWQDEKFIQVFQKLRRQVELITSSSQYRELQVGSGQRIGDIIDPSGFISRTRLGKLHFLLKSRIWNILYEEFFAQPYGFGAFASGSPAKNDLMSLYRAWAKIYVPPGRGSTYNILLQSEADHGADSHSEEDFAVFFESKLANRWRAATFSCIDGAIKDHNWSAWNDDGMSNVVQANRRIEGLLSEVATLSGQVLSDGIKQDIKKTVRIVREIALQVGIHPANISLYTCQRGDRIVIGEEFRDCQNKDLDRGMERSVDVVTMPGLQRIGDGVKDFSMKRVIVPCEVYPDLAPSSR